MSKVSHQRKGQSCPATVRTLRLLLWWLGQGLTLASQFRPSVRSQITRDLIVEISSADGPARYWVFDGQQRRACSYSGPAGASDLAIRFGSSGQALRCLASRKMIDRVMVGRIHGAVMVEGNHLLLMWFRGLIRAVMPIGAAGPRRHALPGAYMGHDPAANGAEDILIEPSERQLDPGWTNAWKARAKLWIVQGARSEPLREP
ncbi:hypothetical protein [Streptomyces sp. NPDC090080]|uniref:hypothetical protein n=1 Tax=Streptomyces sp. NPDC090080 TaxID=3365939 RepID=UPI0038261F06